MTQEAERARAREYLRRKGTLLPAWEIHAREGAAVAALETELGRVTAAEAAARSLPGEWTVQEVADHLVETHRPSVEELRDLLAGRRPASGPIPASLQSADPMGGRWEELVADLGRLHAEVLQILAAAPDALKAARAPVAVVINVREADGAQRPLHWIEELDWKACAVNSSACTPSTTWRRSGRPWRGRDPRPSGTRSSARAERPSKAIRPAGAWSRAVGGSGGGAAPLPPRMD